jgi:hypothetical protein
MSAVMCSGASDFPSSAAALDRSIDELDKAIGRLVRQMNADSYRMLDLVREFDDRLGWMKWQFKSCAEWLAWRCGISLSAAREKVRTAQALRRLRKISAAFAEGRVSYTKIRALTRVANYQNEELLLSHALRAPACEIEERVRQMRNVAPESGQQARRAWQSRFLTAWRQDGRGTLRITVEVPIEEGELILRALDCAVEAGEVTADVGPDAIGEPKSTAWRAQQADALVAIAKSYLEGGDDRGGGATADHYQMVAHFDEQALRGGIGRADLPIDTVKRLLCDCSVVAVVEDEHGTPLDVGRKQRTVSTALKRALYARDRRCTFPGCHRLRYLDAHHLKHWVDGGETSVENLTLLCTHHHRCLHEGGFSIAQEADGTLRFLRADGRRIPRGGYRLEDFVDDDVTGARPSAEACCSADPAQRTSTEVRETAGVYRLRMMTS